MIKKAYKWRTTADFFACRIYVFHFLLFNSKQFSFEVLDFLRDYKCFNINFLHREKNTRERERKR